MFIVQPLRSHHVASGRQVYLWRVSEHIMFEVNDTKQTERRQLDGFIISTLILSACMNTQRNVTAASLLCGDSYISCRWLTLKLVEVSAQDAKLVTQKTNLHKCLKICLATVWLHNMFFFFFPVHQHPQLLRLFKQLPDSSCSTNLLYARLVRAFNCSFILPSF